MCRKRTSSCSAPRKSHKAHAVPLGTHLSPARPALVDAFAAFCAGPAREAAGVYVLGDLFDTWIGDDQLREPLAARVARGLRGIADTGVPVGMINGNRDFFSASGSAQRPAPRCFRSRP